MTNTDRIMLDELRQTRFEIQARIISERKEASGKTRESMAEKGIGPGHAGIEGFAYAGVMEKGRRPGKIPAAFYRKIMEWARYKGISFGSEEELQRFAINTAKAISARGMNPIFFKDIFTSPLESLSNRLPLRLGDEYISELINSVFEWQKQ